MRQARIDPRIGEQVRRMRRKWIGYVLRMTPGEIVCTALTWTPELRQAKKGKTEGDLAQDGGEGERIYAWGLSRGVEVSRVHGF